MITAVADSFGELSLQGREVCVEEEAGHADHAIHGGPNLVTHGGQKHGLGFHGGVRLIHRDLERRIFLHDLFGVALDLLFQSFTLGDVFMGDDYSLL